MKKMLRNKIVCFKKIYKFYSNHFLIKCTVFVLIMKYVIKKNSIFRSNSATYDFKKIDEFYFDHFLIK